MKGKMTWRKLLNVTATSEPIISCTLKEEEMDMEFEPGGRVAAFAFQAWTETRVLFPIRGNDSVWVGYAYRHPYGRQMHPGGY